MAPPLGTTVTLYLVRHGEAAGAAGRCIGHTDLPLSPDATPTLARLAAAWNIPTTADPRLREMNFGAWDGRPWSDLERDAPEALAAWMSTWHDAPVPGGESFGDVIARTTAWLHDAVTSARRDAPPEIAVVAHAGPIRALLVHALQLPRPLAFRLRVDHARVTALRLTVDDVTAACTSAELLFSNADRPPAP